MPLTLRPAKVKDPLHTRSLLEVVINGASASVEIMLGSVAVNIQDPQTGSTALSITAELDNLQMTKLVLSHGANVNVYQYSLSKFQGESFRGYLIVRSGRFPMHRAVFGDHIEIVKLLRQHRANSGARNSADRTVLWKSYSRKNHEIAKILLEAGADGRYLHLLDARTKMFGWQIDRLAVCATWSRNISGCSRIGLLLPDTYPIHFTTWLRGANKLEILLASGGDPNTLMVEDISCLYLAVARGWVDGIFSQLDKGVPINA